MKIRWGNVILDSMNSGVYFTTQQTSKKPRIILDKNELSDKLLMMYDPDAPKPFVHWITTLNGKDILPYYPPSPPKGIHRYVFCLVSSLPFIKNHILNETPSCKPLFYFVSQNLGKGGTRKRRRKKVIGKVVGEHSFLKKLNQTFFL